MVSLGEGMTPLLPLRRLGKALGVPILLMKDEGFIPTGTFKARGAANFLAAHIDDGTLADAGVTIASGGNAEANAVLGDNNLAFVFNTGSAFDQATAGGAGNLFANNDIAEIIGTGSTATAGSDLTTAGNFDLAAAFGDLLHAIATGGNFLWDIPPLPLL